MTGLDGLIQARQSQVANVLADTPVRRMTGADRNIRGQTNFEWLIHKLAIPEEIAVKAIGSLTTNNPNLQFGVGGDTFHNQVGFADLFRESGMDPLAAAILGIGAAIANPLDPLNKLKILGLTKTGRAAEGIKTAGGLSKTAKLPRVKFDKQLAETRRLKKLIKKGEILPENLPAARRSLKQNRQQVRHARELNYLLEELSNRGVTKDSLKLANSTFEQVRQGQRHLLGFSSVGSLDQLSLLGFARGFSSHASVTPLMPAKFASGLIKGIGATKTTITKPLGKLAYKVADHIGIPTAQTAKAKAVGAAVRKVMKVGAGEKALGQLDLQSLYNQFLKEFPDGKELLLKALQEGEWQTLAAKEIAIRELEKAAKHSKLVSGKGVAIGTGKGLTKDQKIQLTQSGVDEAEIPNAIGQFKGAHVDSVFLGKHKQHEAKLLGRYIVVKTRDPKTVLRDLDDLEGIYGNRVWAKYTVPSKESITKATVRVGDKVFEGKSHPEAWGNAAKAEGVKDFDKWLLSIKQKHKLKFDDLEGFKTSRGRVISREEAARVAGDLETDAYGEAAKLDSAFKGSNDGGSTYLVQKRMPSAKVIKSTDDLRPAHIEHLQRIAAQLSRQKKTLVGLTSKDILVSPSGAVQIINPSVIDVAKSQKDAVVNSNMAIEGLLNELSYPSGTVRELHHLKNSVTANRVPKGLDGLSFRRLEAPTEYSSEVVDHNAHDLLEEAVNAEGFKDVIRASYDEITPRQLAESIGDPRDFNRANQVEFYQEQIREAVRKGEPAIVEPVAVVRDDYGNLHIASSGGRARVTAAILEGYETIPVYQRNFLGEVVDATAGGHYTGSTFKLADLWEPATDSSARNLSSAVRRLPKETSDDTVRVFGNGDVAENYSLLNNEGEVVKLVDGSVDVDPEFAELIEKTVAKRKTGKARKRRIASANQILEEKFGSVRNGLLRLANIAEEAPDVETFTKQLRELFKVEGKQQLDLANAYEALSIDTALLTKIRNTSTRTLDDLASKGILTRKTIDDTRRVKLATEGSDLVVRVMEPDGHSLRVVSNSATVPHLRKIAKSYINKVVTAADIEPYGRIRLVGSDGSDIIEVKDLVEEAHPLLSTVQEPVKRFSIAKEQAKALEKKGVLVADSTSTKHVKEQLEKKGVTAGILVKEKDVPTRGAKGTFTGAGKERVVVTPEYPFFVTRSGSVAIGTKHRTAKDLLDDVFEEGPAFFQEIGVMTKGKIVMSNAFGNVIEKIGVGEMRQLTTRLREIAQKFSDLGLSRSTVLDMHVPFDDAVWRSIYGERTTIGDILDDGFKLKIPDELLNHTPDIRVAAPGRFTIDNPTGVVAVERTRLSNKKLQDLIDALEETNDADFIFAAKNGLPIAYHHGYMGRHLTEAAKEGLREAYIKFPGKESATFKHIESILKGRVLTDLTTLEINSIIKRLHKEGVEGVEGIISDVVASYREGYKIAPSAERAARLVAIADNMPEGIQFFHTDPIYATALSQAKTHTAVTRQQVVQTLKDSDVAVWSGTVKELNEVAIKRNKTFAKYDKEYATLNDDIAKVNSDISKLESGSPDLAGGDLQTLKGQLDELMHKKVLVNEKRMDALAKTGKDKVMDTMIDPEANEVWMKGEDLQRMIDEGLIDPSDIRGDPTDALIRVPVTKYKNMLDDAGSEIFMFPREVAGVVQNYFGTTTKDGFGKFLSLWDTVHNAWRQWTLFPIPAYHIRNGISNFFMAWLGDVHNPSVYFQSDNMLNIIKNYRNGGLTKKELAESLGVVSFTSAGGEVVSGKTLFDEFVKHGGLSGGLHYNEFTSFGTLARASDFERLSVKAGLRPASELAGSWLFDNAALRGGVSVASGLENRFRLAVFIDAFSKGRVDIQGGKMLTGFDAAAMHMKRVLYDYTDLSAFERSWLRRVLPFYTWSRHNVPRMISTLITDPVKHYRIFEFFNDLEKGITKGKDRDTHLPQWVRDRYGLVIHETSNNHWVVKTGDGLLPMFDAYKVLAGHGITEMLEDGMTPFVKVPIEQLTNYSLYTGRKLEQIPGQRSKSFTLGSLGFSRRATTKGPLGVLNIALNESMFKTFFRPGGEIATKLIDPIFDPDPGYAVTDRVVLATLSLALGRAYAIDPARAKVAIFKDWRKRHQQISSLRDRARSDGDTRSAEDADKLLTWLTLQYPGK